MTPPADDRTDGDGLQDVTLDLTLPEWAVLVAAAPAHLVPPRLRAAAPAGARTTGADLHEPELRAAATGLLRRGVLVPAGGSVRVRAELLAVLATAARATTATHVSATVGQRRRELVAVLLGGALGLVLLQHDDGVRVALQPVDQLVDHLESLLAGAPEGPAAQTAAGAGAVRVRLMDALVLDAAVHERAGNEAAELATLLGVRATLPRLRRLSRGARASLRLRTVHDDGTVTHHADWLQDHDGCWTAVTLAGVPPRGPDHRARAERLIREGMLVLVPTDRAAIHEALLGTVVAEVVRQDAA